MSSIPLKIVCCCSNNDEDQKMLDQLKMQFSLLQRQGKVTLWSNNDIHAGEEVEESVAWHLEQADVILLLISPNFIDGNESMIKQAVACAEQRSVHVILVKLRSVNYEDAPFAKFPLLPRNGEPVMKWTHRDDAFCEIERYIRKYIRNKFPLASTRPVSRRQTSLLILMSSMIALIVIRTVFMWVFASRTTTAIAKAPGSYGITATAIFIPGPPTPLVSHPTATLGPGPTVVTAPPTYLGRIWHVQPLSTAANLNAIVVSPSQLIALGSGGSIQISQSGRTWVTENSPTSVDLLAGAWSGFQFTAVGAGGISVSSLDGHAWTAQYNWAGDLRSIVWTGTEFVLVGDGGGIYTSSDGHTWLPQYSGTLQTLYGIAWSGKEFVVVGADGTVLESSDSHVWTEASSGTQQTLDGIVWSGRQFVAVGTDATILTSPNGSIWTIQQSVTAGETLLAVTYGAALLVAVGSGGTVLVSSDDGATWFQQHSGTQQTLNGAVWSGSQFLIAGNDGTVLTSS